MSRVHADISLDRPVPAGAAPTTERETYRARVVAALEGARLDPPAGRLRQLAERFGLTPAECDVLAVLWVTGFDPELRARLAMREAFAGQITVRSIPALFGHAARIRLPSDSPLLRWQLVEEHPLIDGTAALGIDPAIVAWLEGDHELDRALAGRVRLLPESPELQQWPVDALARRLEEALRRGKPSRVLIDTDDEVAARWFAAALARRLDLPVLDVPGGALAAEPDAGVRLHRQAFLDGCVPCFCLDDIALARPRGVVACPIQFVHGHGPRPQPDEGVQDLECRLPPPDTLARESLWRLLWPESAAWPDGRLQDLALCHEASVGDIVAAAGAAPADAHDAARALREHTRDDLGLLARRVDSAFTWDDLVLPDPVQQRLKDIAFEARERARVWSDPAARRLFPYGRGLVALFAGPPGTGKTMAAQVIATELGMDLLSVDLSAVVSKWVGETAQHLQQLLSSRAARRGILFFDEADALFAKRIEDTRDAQDRFANSDTSHLMTALESHPGIVLLASNLKGNIDSAFLRRIRHVIDFPRPDPQARERIWRQVVQVLFAPKDAGPLDDKLARIARVECSGAVIKNAALSALLKARRSGQPPTLRLLADTLAREMGKEGAGLSSRDVDDIAGDGA